MPKAGPKSDPGNGKGWWWRAILIGAAGVILATVAQGVWHLLIVHVSIAFH